MTPSIGFAFGGEASIESGWVASSGREGTWRPHPPADRCPMQRWTCLRRPPWGTMSDVGMRVRSKRRDAARRSAVRTCAEMDATTAPASGCSGHHPIVVGGSDGSFTPSATAPMLPWDALSGDAWRALTGPEHLACEASDDGRVISFVWPLATLRRSGAIFVRKAVRLPGGSRRGRASARDRGRSARGALVGGHLALADRIRDGAGEGRYSMLTPSLFGAPARTAMSGTRRTSWRKVGCATGRRRTDSATASGPRGCSGSRASSGCRRR